MEAHYAHMQFLNENVLLENIYSMRCFLKIMPNLLRICSINLTVATGRFTDILLENSCGFCEIRRHSQMNFIAWYIVLTVKTPESF